MVAPCLNIVNTRAGENCIRFLLAALISVVYRLLEIATGSAIHAAGILHSTMLNLPVPTHTPTITLLVPKLTETMLRQQVGIASMLRTEKLRLS
jgi:hypothetical protein